MADIQIHREHALGLPQARKIAFTWAGQAEEKFEGAIVKNLDALIVKKPAAKKKTAER